MKFDEGLFNSAISAFGDRFEVLVWTYRIFVDEKTVTQAIYDYGRVYSWPKGLDGIDLEDIKSAVRIEMFPGVKSIFDAPADSWMSGILAFREKLDKDIKLLEELLEEYGDDFTKVLSKDQWVSGVKVEGPLADELWKMVEEACRTKEAH